MQKTNTLLITAAAACVHTIATPTPAAASTLYGTTLTDVGTSTSTVVTIDPATGAATPLFTFTLPDGLIAARLTYHDPSGDLLSLFRSGGVGNDFRLARIDLQTQAATSEPITGLPPGVVEIEGLGYDAANDRTLISHGPSFFTDSISQIGLDGAVIASSGVISGVTDMDNIDFNDAAGLVYATDFNANNPPRVFQVIDPLGTPSAAGLFDPGQEGDVGDVALDPDTGQLYTAGFGAFDSNLVAVSAAGYVAVGPYNIGANIGGLAFAGDVTPPCPTDLNGSGATESGDLNILLAAFASTNAGDIDGDGDTDSADLNLLLAAFGTDCR